MSRCSDPIWTSAHASLALRRVTWTAQGSEDTAPLWNPFTRGVSTSTPDQELVLTHFIVSDDVERSRRFYTDVLAGTVARSGEPTNVALATPRGTGRPLSGCRVRPAGSPD